MAHNAHEIKTTDPHNHHVAFDEECSTHKEHVEVDDEPVPHIHFKTYLIVLAVCFVYTAQVIHLVGTGAFGSAISATVGGQKEAFWLVAMCALEVAVLAPPVSQIADLWGRRWALIIPTFFGIVGSIILARANSMSVALVGNAITAASFAAQPLLHAVASEVLTHRNRVAAQAAVNVGSGLGGVIGLLAGAAFTKNSPAGFRNYWYMAAGVYAVGTLALLALYTPPLTELQRSMDYRQKLRKLDWIGYILLTCGLVLFMFGLSVADNLYPWDNVHTLAPLIIGALLLVLFVYYEGKVKKEGMVHHDLFSRDRNFAIALGCIFAEGLFYFSANAYFPYEVGVLYATDPMKISLHFAVALITYTVLVVAPAIYCYRTKKLRLPAMFAFGSFLTFSICMSTATPGSATAVWIYPVFLGLGLAAALCSLVSAAQLSAPGYLIGTTSGLMISMRSLGGSIGLAIYTAIFHSKISTEFPSRLAKAVLPLGLPSSSLPELIGDIMMGDAQDIAKIPGVTPQIAGVAFTSFKDAFAASVRYVWVTASVFAFLALCASFFLINPTGDFNLHIDAPAESDEALYGDTRQTTVDEKQV